MVTNYAHNYSKFINVITTSLRKFYQAMTKHNYTKIKRAATTCLLAFY